MKLKNRLITKKLSTVFSQTSILVMIYIMENTDVFDSP